MTNAEADLHRRTGAYGEELVCAHLVRRGWAILARNWRCWAGEADILALTPDGCTFVVCEVKTRTGYAFGDPLEAITGTKVAHLRAVAAAYLAEHPLGVAAVRFDAVAVHLSFDRPPRLRYVEGAA